jgi:hypothetical protein
MLFCPAYVDAMSMTGVVPPVEVILSVVPETLVTPPDDVASRLIVLCPTVTATVPPVEVIDPAAGMPIDDPMTN